MLLYIPDALASATLMVEERDVASIALWIVCTYKAQQRRLSCTILSRQRPSFAVVDSPVEVFQYCALAINDAHLIHLHHHVGIIVVVFVWQRQYSLCLFFAQHARWQWLSFGEKILLSHLFAYNHILHLNDMCDKRWDVVRFRQHKNYLQCTLVAQLREQFCELMSGFAVKSDKWIIHYQHPWLGKEHCGELKLS